MKKASYFKPVTIHTIHRALKTHVSYWMKACMAIFIGGVLMSAKFDDQRNRPQTAGYLLPADSLLFRENFAGATAGSSALSFKTNGAKTVTAVAGQAGKWLTIQNQAMYKLTRQIMYPRRFSVEFDLLATADQVKDIAPLSFGFASDNSVREYQSTTGTYVQLHYYDTNAVYIGSSEPKQFLSTTFDLEPTINRPLHITLIVNGENMTVYLDKTKLADTQLFKPQAAKNFFISAPWEYANGSKVYVSNLNIKKL